jgi:hypothetical protein
VRKYRAGFRQKDQEELDELETKHAVDIIAELSKDLKEEVISELSFDVA